MQSKKGRKGKEIKTWKRKGKIDKPRKVNGRRGIEEIREGKKNPRGKRNKTSNTKENIYYWRRGMKIGKRVEKKVMWL